VGFGGAPADVAGALALAASPAFAGFLLLPRLGERWADAGFIAVWALMATGLAAGAGGAASPLSASFATLPAVAIALGRRWAPEAGAVAVIGYAAASALALVQTPPLRLGPFGELMAVVSLAFAAGLMALGSRSRSHDRAAGQRIAEVSHELRTPLTHILGFSEMIERQMFGEISARYVEYAGLIRRSGAHLLALVNDLLDLSKIDAGRYELELATFDARNVIADIVRLSADAAEKKSIALGMVTPDAPLAIHADERALRRILINTIGNAIKFTPEGGRVMIVAASAAGQLQVDTIDTGPGISEADREKLGRAYERGSGGARAEGTGLGLALVRALAELHGGALSFEDAPEGGALVRVRLPVLTDG
jgi:signal transduction histidine kinase